MIKLKSIIQEINNIKMKKTYCAVLLSKESKYKLYTEFKQYIPDGWETIIHHITIDPFKTLPVDSELLGKQQIVLVTHIGISDKAIAVKVTGLDIKTNNKFPHITLAVNRNGGGKPKHSNDITKWTELDTKIYIKGTIENI